MSITATAQYRQPSIGQAWWKAWLSFFGQIVLVTSVELSDEFLRGMITHSNSHSGQVNAGQLVRFEAAHGFWVEPGWQAFFRQSHHLLDLTLTWDQVVPIVNSIYLFGHIGVTLLFALWVFLYRRGVFAFLRNVFFITNALALVLYEAYPLAPPRLTIGLEYEGHPYHFVDTMFALLKDGKVVGTQVGFNEFAAMPSLHVGWAVIVSAGLIWLARPWLIRVLAPLYPVIMTVAVVVSGNHYLMDGVGAVGILLVAIVLAGLYQWWRERPSSLSAMLRRLQAQSHEPTKPPWHVERTPVMARPRAVAR